jgi:hypothetical protein
MMGRQSGDQASLIYEFCLDDRVPKNHLLRRINVFVTAALADVHEQLDSPLQRDRPAIDRPGVDDPGVDCWVLLRSAVGAQADPGS